MDGRCRDDLADELEGLVVPYPGDGSAAEIAARACLGLERRRALAACRKRRARSGPHSSGRSLLPYVVAPAAASRAPIGSSVKGNREDGGLMADGQGSCSLCSNTAVHRIATRTYACVLDLAVLGAAVIVACRRRSRRHPGDRSASAGDIGFGGRAAALRRGDEHRRDRAHVRRGLPIRRRRGHRDVRLRRRRAGRLVRRRR